MSSATPIQMFSFGYWGWGNATPRLLEAVDAVEHARGFGPPLFVDIRIRRQVRAVGFSDNAFENLAGSERHRWMPKLGNRSIVTKTGPAIQIDDPAAANNLLELAVQADADGRRVIYFCSCEFPLVNGENPCHRRSVTELLLAAASGKDQRLDITEWPGGEPQHVEVKVDASKFKYVKGRRSIPIADELPLAEIAGLGWGSTLTLRTEGRQIHRVVGPAKWMSGGWCVPIVWPPEQDSDLPLAEYVKRGQQWRESYGMLPASSE